MGDDSRMAVWAVYGRPTAGGRWYLRSVSVVSAERARALAARDRTAPTEPELAEPCPDLVVRKYAALQAVTWWLEPPAE